MRRPYHIRGLNEKPGSTIRTSERQAPETRRKVETAGEGGATKIGDDEVGAKGKVELRRIVSER